MTTATTSGSTFLAGHVRLIRAAADLLEQAGIPGLALYPEPGEIEIQVPEHCADLPARTAMITRLAALIGAEPAPCPHPGAALGWIEARGQHAGHLVHIYTPVRSQGAS